MHYRLRPIYNLGAYCAAFCLCLICAMITAQILGRIVDHLATWTGNDRIGLAVPGLAEVSGFLLVGASFLGLAYTFVNGGHIRVTLLIGKLPGRARVFVEVWCLSIALLLCVYLGWYTFWLLHDSYSFGETSYGMVPVPLWIPQSAMLAGIVLLFLALTEAWLTTLRIALTRPSTYVADDESHA